MSAHDPLPKGAAWLLGPNEVAIFSDCVTLDEQRILADWSDTAMARNALLENPRAPGSFSTPYLSDDGGLTPLTRAKPTNGHGAPVWVPQDTDKVPPLPQAFWLIRDRVITLLGLTGLPEDPYKGSFLNHIVTGGAVHQHVDSRLKLDTGEAMILRCNILFRAPDEGGAPVIGGHKFDIPERGGWAFYATEVDHLATSVSGRGGRSTLSFGFAVTHQIAQARRFRVAPALAAAFQSPDAQLSADLLITQMEEAGALASVGQERLSAVRAMLEKNAPFSLGQIAAAHSGADQVWPVVRQLQLAGLIESLSQTNGPQRIQVV